MAASLAAILAACDGAGPGASAPAAPAAGEVVVPIETVRVERGTIERRISAPGSLVARRESRIGTEVQGRLERVLVEEGDRVDAGALLFQIDPEPYQLALRQAEARRDLARAERRQVAADLARARALQARDVVSQQELDRLATQEAVARATERQAEEAVALAARDLERTSVRAPYDASVVARLADEGTTALVQPQTIVIVLQETAELEAVATIPESEMAALRPGDPARVYVEGRVEPIETRLSAVGDAIEEATRTFQVKMRVPNADHALKAGVFARVEIEPQDRHEALLVPREAVRSEDGRTRVFTVRDGRATPVAVRLGAVSDTHAEVLEGLGEGEAVIVGASARELAPGLRVRSRNPAAAHDPAPEATAAAPVPPT